jgi:hypothetical protein
MVYSTCMVREFVDTVDTFLSDGAGDAVTFVRQPGCYFLRPRPGDVRETLRAALYSGVTLRVRVDDQTFEIDDVVPA